MIILPPHLFVFFIFYHMQLIWTNFMSGDRMTCLEGAPSSTRQSKVKWREPRSWRRVRPQRPDSPHTVRYVSIQTCLPRWNTNVTEPLINHASMCPPPFRSWVWTGSPVLLRCSHLKMVSSARPWLKKHAHWLLTPTDLLQLKSCPGKYLNRELMCAAISDMCTTLNLKLLASQTNPHIGKDRGWTAGGCWERCGWGCQVNRRQTGSCWYHCGEGQIPVQGLSISEYLFSFTHWNISTSIAMTFCTDITWSPEDES